MAKKWFYAQTNDKGKVLKSTIIWFNTKKERSAYIDRMISTFGLWFYLKHITISKPAAL